MKGTSKVVMGATLLMVVSLAIVLSLVLVLLAELYCSLFLRRRKPRTNTSNTTTTTRTATAIISSQHQPQDESTATPSLGSFYAQGVLRAPRSFLFPAVSGKDKVDIEKQHSQPLQTIESPTPKPCSTPRHVGLLFTSPPSPTFKLISSPPPPQKVPLQCGGSTYKDEVCGDSREHFVYISNPIYNNEGGGEADTPFETPDTSPSRLEMSGSSGDEDRDQSLQSSPPSLPITPPLTPMKKLPAEACSVSLRDARSLGTSGSDSNSNRGVSSSSSGSPCTSPSW